MTRLRQVRHIVVKDMREAKWYIAVYVVLVAIATANSVTVPRPAGGTLWPMLATGAGILLLAMQIQSDSPSRTAAFWRSRPLDSLAMLGAKLVLALVIVCVGLGGQAVGLAAHDVTGIDLLRLLGRTVVTYFHVLVFTAVVAALTRNLSQYVLALVAILIVMTLVTVVVPLEPDARGYNALMAIATFLTPMLLLLAWQYRSRRTRAVAAAAVLVLLLTTAAVPLLPDMRSNRARASDVPEALQAPLVPLKTGRRVLTGRSNDQPSLALTVAEPPDGYRHVLTAAGATLLNGAGVVRHVATGMYPDLLHGARADVGAGVWLDRTQTAASVTVDLTRDEEAAIESGAAWLEIRGTVRVEEARVSSALPLRSGRKTAAHGARVAVGDVNPDGGTVQIFLSSINAGTNPIGRIEPRTFVLLNRTRSPAEAVTVDRVRASSSTFGLVVPGAPSTAVDLTVGDQPNQAGQPDAAWLAGAELLAVAWVPVGSYESSVVLRMGMTELRRR